MFAALLMSGVGCVPILSVPRRVALEPQFTLTSVKGPAEAEAGSGPPRVVTAIPDSAGYARYSDSRIAAWFYPTDTRIFFGIENRTETPIQIDWTQAAFRDLAGMSQAVMHQGIRYVECAGVKAPSVIVPHARIIDQAIPCNYVRERTGSSYSPHASYGESAWEVASYLGDLTASPDSVVTVAAVRSRAVVNRSVQLLVPIRVHDMIQNYTFSFSVTALKTPTVTGGWSGVVGLARYRFDGTLDSARVQILSVDLKQQGDSVTGTGTITGMIQGTVAVQVAGTITDYAVALTCTSAHTSPIYAFRLSGFADGRSIRGSVHDAGFAGQGVTLFRRP